MKHDSLINGIIMFRRFFSFMDFLTFAIDITVNEFNETVSPRLNSMIILLFSVAAMGRHSVNK